MILPVISIKQPWAWAILHAGKDVENRTWDIPRRFIGKPVLIHAGKQIDREAVIHLLHLNYRLPERLETGGIVGVAVFDDCANDTGQWAEPGLCHWGILRAAPLPFFACNGRLGFFSVDYPHSLPAVRP